MNKLVTTAAAASLWLLASAVTACAPSTPDEPGDEDVTEDEDALRQFCGGIAGFACPEGRVCVDDPHDSCDPTAGGADCGGICKQAKPTKQKCKDESRDYVSTDPAQCALVKFYCADGGTAFFDDCGCGCEVQPGAEPCGGSECGAGEYCCNESCGICAPDGGFCIQQFCGLTCELDSCGPALGMPNTLCSDNVSVAGPTGNCVDQGGVCGWEIATCP